MSYIAAKFKGTIYPFVKVITTREGYIFSFIGTPHHLSLHKARATQDGDYTLVEKDGGIDRVYNPEQKEAFIVTSRSSEKLPHSWTDKIIEIAKKNGFRNPERHAEYFLNQIIFVGEKIEGMEGQHLVGRTIDLRNLSPQPKKNDLEIAVNNERFFCELYLSSQKNFRNGFRISLGNDLEVVISLEDKK